ncbi:MAG: glutathione S-transferase N-terminal domain-containing protein [Gallionellaceae bacterium]
MIKIFFKTLRLVLMPFMLLWAKIGTPQGIERSGSAQHDVDVACQKLALYHFKTCPFCIKVRHEMARLSLPINLREAQYDETNRAILLQGGGKVQTPCLQITNENGEIQWLYESKDIINYLQQRFS